MCGSNDDTLHAADFRSGHLQGLSERGSRFDLVSSDRVMETRLGLSVGVRRSLTGPMTALAAQVEASLLLLERSVESFRSTDLNIADIEQALALLKDASSDAQRSVELMQHWKSIQNLLPGRRALGRPGQLLQDLILMLKPRLDDRGHRVELQIASLKSVYLDQFAFVQLLEELLLDNHELGQLSSLVVQLDCFEQMQNLNVRLRLAELNSSADAAGTQQRDNGELLNNKAAFRGASQDDIDAIAEKVGAIGAELQWSVVTATGLDIGFSFRFPNSEIN